ncbi:MAG: serine/threonine protein kinase [Deltaproteobacteria bacterium]|nr:serine/threonine protein kinase [Deltaproteobacteria bacterium]
MGDALIGTTVEERYRIEALLGAGAMGRVYRARHVRVSREVAIKVMRADLVSEPSIVARFEREAQIAAHMRHPNLVGVLDVGATPTGEHLMVMELAPGVSLAELVEAPMSRDRVVSLLSQLLRGLAFAHDAGLIHRDLKPENVLVDVETWHARIVDFGIAVLRDREGVAAGGRRLTDAGLVVGTPMYMAPEQASGKAVDHRTDLFALGVIAYELLAGATPFEGTGAEVALANVTQDPPYIADRVPGLVVDPLLETFTRTLMARRPDERFASAHDALRVLEMIDRDREAAAAMLGLRRVPMLEAPPAQLRLPRGSDALSTLPMAEPEHDAAPATQTMPEAEWTERIVRTPRRRGAIVVATLAVVALLAAWVIRGSSSHAPITAAPAAQAPVVVERTEAPPHAEVVAPAPQPALPPRKLARVAQKQATVTPAPPVAPAPARDTSADALAARYRAIGNALHARGTDELWQRYRLIHLGDAMASADTREQAFAALDAIEHALPARS